MKKLGILALILLLLIQSMVIAQTYDGTGASQLDETWFNTLKSTGQIPNSYTYYLEGKGYANKEIYEELGLLVYGSPKEVYDNDFKVVEGGYYKNEENQVGEFRYHGYNVGGEKFPNDLFPPDATSDTKVEKKIWSYKPWDEESYGHRSFVANYSDKGIPEINKEILKNMERVNEFKSQGKEIPEFLQNFVLYENQINEGMPFNLGSADVIYTDNQVNTSSLEGGNNFVNYTAISQAPSSVYNGQSVMFHKSKYGEGKNGAWYHTMPISKVTYKYPNNIEAKLEVVNKTYDKENKVWHFKLLLIGKILDDDVFTGSQEEINIKKQTNINREDILDWDMTLDSINVIPTTLNEKGKFFYPIGTSSDAKKHGANSANTYFDLSLNSEVYESLLDEDHNLNVDFVGKVTANLRVDDGKLRATATTDDSVTGEAPIEIEEVKEPLKKKLEFQINAPTEILDKWVFPLSETMIESEGLASKHVLIEGVRLSESEQNKFLSGQYKFPEIGQDKIYTYKIMYEHLDGEFYYYQSYVVVYDHHPRFNVSIENYSKINRRMTVEVDYSITPDFVKNNTSIQVSGFDVSSEQTIHYGDNSSSKKEFLIKEVGSVNVDISVSNEYATKNYKNDLYVGDDYRPDIFAMIWNNNLARKDSLNITSEEASVDGDNINPMTYIINYDSDDDGLVDTKVFEGIWTGSTNYVPEKLGFYQITWSVKESFGEPTLLAYITDEDYKKFEVTREFFVDNIVPMTKLYTDIEYNFPKLDVIILLDSHLNESAIQEVKSNAVNIRNNFRLNSMVADVQIWDTKTYIQDTTASKNIGTGGSYPSSTYNYNENGYTGTLSRLNVNNNPYDVDNGRYVNKSTQTPVFSSRYDSGDGPPGTSRGSSNVPYSISEQGTTLSEVSGSYVYTSDPIMENGVPSSWKYHWTRSASYSGTVTTTTSVWQSNWDTYNSYTGYYSGTVYKSIKQAFTPNFQVDSNKYIIYLTDEQLSSDSITDFNKVKSLAKDSVTYIVVDDISKVHSLGDTIFFPYETDVIPVINNIVKSIKEKNPIFMAFTLLQNQSFSLSYTDIDHENDPLINTQSMFYTHDKDYFDNPTGQEPGTYANYNFGNWTSQLKTSFNSVGKYTVYRKIEDEPIGFADKGLESNIANLEIIIHRRPIANYVLDWSYNPIKGYYETTWVDKSYDLDFEFTEPINKGIVERKIKYRRNGGAWIYEVPENLLPGTYDLEYIVKDSYGAWSDVKTQRFTLASAPPVQIMNAQLKATLDNFTLNYIPASENITFYDVVSRHPYDTYLSFGVYKNGVLVSPQLTKIFSGADTKIEQEIMWSDTVYNIPKTLADGNYEARIYLIDKNNINNFVYKPFDITIFTPINLNGQLTSLIAENENEIIATTSKYVDQVEITLFKNEPQEETVQLSRVNETTWSTIYNASIMPDGDYSYEFRASVPSIPRKFENQNGILEFISLRIDDMKIWGEWTHWRGQIDLLGKLLPNNPHRFMGYEKVYVEVTVQGDPDSVDIRFSPELEAMNFVNSLGHAYSYKEHVGYNVTFPLSLNTSDNKTFLIEYILPLANTTLSEDELRLRPQYWVTVTARKGAIERTMTISDLDMTGNIFDKIYSKPE